MRSLCYISGVLLTVFSFQSLACAFNFTAGTPTECGNLNVTWQGGTPPIRLHLIPVYDVPINITMPSTAVSNGKGSYSYQLPFPENRQFLISMSDGSGFGAGGVSALLTVGPSQGGICNTTSPSPDFTYQLNTPLQQCSPFTVSNYSKGVQPVSLYGLIPLGDTFIVQQPMGQTTFNWIADVAAGTDIIFFMVDSQGHQGGGSNITQVGSSDDASCLKSSSPASTTTLVGSSTHTSSIPTSTSTSTSTDPSKSSGNITTGGIAGTVIGGIVFLAVVITLVLFFRRKQNARRSQGGFERQPEHGGQMDPPSGPHLGSSASAYTLQSSYQRDINPFGSTASAPYQSPINTHQAHNARPLPTQPSESGGQLSNPHSPTSLPIAASAEASSRIDSEQSSYERKKAKALAAGIQPPPRYIVHTVGEDEVPRPDKNSMMELPPRYTTIIDRLPPTHLPT